MINIIKGGFYEGAKNSIIPQIKRLVEEKKRCFLIVPEQQTLISEGEMASLLPQDAPLYFEVSNFSRFADTGFRALGGIAAERVDRTKRMLVMWQTLKSLSGVLSMTRSQREINTGTVDNAIRAVVKMQSAAIDSEELNRISEHSELSTNERLRRKLSDLSLIMSLYQKTLMEKYKSTGDDISLLCSLLEKNPSYLSDAHIFIEGFTSLTEPQYKLIGVLAKRCNVTVVLTISKHLEKSIEYTEPRLMEERLKMIARRTPCEIKITRNNEKVCGTEELLCEAGELLWQNFATIDYKGYTEKQKEALSVFEAKSPYEMCDFVASDIKRRVISGARYCDFAVICRDSEEYAGILSSAFSNNDIPSFTSSARSVMSFEAVKLINSAFRSVIRSFRREDVISYAKSSLCGISRRACDEFEEYTYKWQISGERFTDGLMWNMSPCGLGAKSENDAEKLISIDSTRRKIIEPLLNFGESLSDCNTVLSYSKALYAFLESIKLERALEKQAEELARSGEASLAEDNLRLWNIICDSLDVLCEVLGELEASREEYLSLLNIVFSSASVGKIPSYLDEVTLGSADMIRLNKKKHIYLIGVNNGEFPRGIKDNSYFSEREKAALSQLGLPLSPESESDYARELFAFSRAFSYAEKSVTLIYTSSMRDFSKCERSPVIDRLVKTCENELKIKKISDFSPLDLIYTQRSALSALGKLSGCEYRLVNPLLAGSELGELLEVTRGQIANRDLSLSESLSEIYGGDIRLSQSRLERYNNCPFSYFCSYNLGLDEGEKAKFDARNIGSFIHSILENFFKEVKEKGLSVSEITEDTKLEIITKNAKSYINSISEGGGIASARGEVMLNRLTKSALPIIDGLCKEFSGCDYLPTYFELDIGKGKTHISPSSVKYKTESGKNVYVAGIIDRVDTYKSGDDVYVRVVDYKTGQKEFSPDDLDAGDNLQMFLYLKAICDTKNDKFRDDIGVGKDGKLIPAGVIYVKTDVSDTTIDTPSEEEALLAFEKKQSRKGMLLDDGVSIGAMNADFIPVRYNKDGSPDKKSQKNLYTLDTWNELMGKVENAVCRIADSMEKGDIKAIPKQNGKNSPCDYCPYKAICRASIKG